LLARRIDALGASSYLRDGTPGKEGGGPMGREVGDGRSKEVFRSLAREEQAHLVRMTSLLDRLLGKG